MTKKAKPKPTAFLHTLHMEGEQTYTKLSFYGDPYAEFGTPGKDFSKEYKVTVEPLYKLDASNG